MGPAGVPEAKMSYVILKTLLFPLFGNNFFLDL